MKTDSNIVVVAGKKPNDSSIALMEIEKGLYARGYRLIAGVDEVGRGPLAGPVVAAAVLFEKGVFIDGVKDSKKLSERKRGELYDRILGSAINVGIGLVDNVEIDRVNIYQASVLAMQLAVDKLETRPELILADGNLFRHGSLRYENIVDGDAKCFSIAAASIIAKVTRDRLMAEYHKQFPEYGFARHKGYGTKAHFEAIRKYGICTIHRRSFKTTGNQ